MKELAAHCVVSASNLYHYFKNKDDLIIESTAYCMEKVEDDFMMLAPEYQEDVIRFLNETPEWTAKKHGKKYRMMYQVYTHPKYFEHGKSFFEGCLLYTSSSGRSKRAGFTQKTSARSGNTRIQILSASEKWTSSVSRKRAGSMTA